MTEQNRDTLWKLPFLLLFSLAESQEETRQVLQPNQEYKLIISRIQNKKCTDSSGSTKLLY